MRKLAKSRSRRSSRRRVPWGEILIMSIETLWSNKLRSGLTMLGVIIGISSVIIITALGHLDAARSVVFLGSKLRDTLFNTSESPIGTDIRIQGKRYTVVGVAKSKGSVGGQDLDDIVYIPLSNMSAQIVGNNALTGIAINGFWLEAGSAEQLNSAQFQVTNILRLRHRIRPPGLDDFRVINQVDIIKTFTNVMASLTLLVGAIAGISLLVGGIGIANIMLVSVMERPREIGIRKAVGATSSSILSQFLTEAIVISVMGGAIGVGLGIGVAFTAATVFKFPFIVPLWLIVAGFGLSLIVGVLAGGMPARNAAKLDPITALHNQ
jgi:putative ABC transport system permease protein